MKKVPLKGEPNFTVMNSYTLQMCLNSVETLLHAYSSRNGFQNEHEVLEHIWKHLSDEEFERIYQSDYEKVHPFDLTFNNKTEKKPKITNGTHIPKVSSMTKLKRKGVI